jgi:hypothetical protein
VRAVFVTAGFACVSMCCHVMRDIFVHWSNVLTWFVSRTIAG